MKIIIPIAGKGSRLLPHTLSFAKPLMKLGKDEILKLVVDNLRTLNFDEIIFVINYKKEQVISFLEENFSNLNYRVVVQKSILGDGEAILEALDELSLEELDDDTFIIYGSDTLIDFDVKKSLSRNGLADVILFSKEVVNPSDFGVIEVDNSNKVFSIEEKPDFPKSNFVLIGAYYFKNMKVLREILSNVKSKGILEKGEFRLVSAIKEYISDMNYFVKMFPVEEWFDSGNPKSYLDTNAYVLSKKSKVKKAFISGDNSLVIPPCYIGNDVILENSIVGPNVSIHDGSVVRNSIIKNSVVYDNADLDSLIIRDSIVGKSAKINAEEKKISVSEKSVTKY